MSSPKSLFGKTSSKKAKIDNEEKQELMTPQNTGRNNPSTSVRKPAFNPALLSSAFYTGPTMYGGAGACSSSSPFNQYSKSKFYDRKKTDIKVTPSTSNNSMSQTSRHILELLERYSSPISDAKRVPINNKPTSVTKRPLNSSIFDISKKAFIEDTQPSTSKSHRFRELQIPSISTLMKIKKNNRIGGNSHAAILASMSSSLPYKPESYSLRSNTDSSSYKSKIKSKLGSRSNKVDEDKMAEPVNLPYISLQMTGLPTFTMEPFKLQPNSTKSSSATKTDTMPLPSTSVTTNFKFTSPVTLAKTDMNRATTKFKFSEPLDIFSSNYSSIVCDEPDATKSHYPEAKKIKSDNADVLSKEVKTSKSDSTPSQNFKSSISDVTPKLSSNRPPELWNGNDYKHNEKDKSPLLNGDIKSTDTYGKRSYSTYDTSNSAKGKDKSNFGESISNENKKVKSETIVPSPASGSMESIIKKQQQQWECDSCMTRNEQSQLKCICCTTPKPGEKPPPPKAASTSQFIGMENFIKKQQQQWECPGCMIRNDQDRTICPSCDSPKPGSKPTPAAAMNFNFGTTPNTFKFGIDKANDPVTTTLDSKPPTANNKVPEISLPTSGFTFGSSTSIADAKPGNGSIGGFKFGIPNSTTPKLPEVSVNSPLGLSEKKETSILSPPSGGFAFGIPSTVESKVSSEPSTTTEIKPTFSFSSPLKTSEPKGEPEKPVINFMASVESKTTIPAVATKPADNSVSSVTSSSLIDNPIKSTPVFSFGSQSTSKPAFGSGGFQFAANPSSTSNATSDTSVKPSPGLFSFGSKNTSSLDTKTSSEIPKPAFQLPNPGSGSILSSSNISTSLGKENVKTSNIGSGIPFSSGSLPEKPTEQNPPGGFFSFGSTPTNVSNAPSISNPNSNTAAFTFGMAATTKPETQSLFKAPTINTPSNNLFNKPSTVSTINSPPSALFKPTPSTTPSSFTPSNMFGSSLNTAPSVPSTNLFGSGSLNSTITKPPVPIFGSPPIAVDHTSQPSQTGSLFTSPSVPAFNSGNIFGNTTQTNPLTTQPTNLFGNSMNKPASEGSSGMFMNNPQPPTAASNMFGSAMAAAAPTQSGATIYGSSPSVPTPVFGASIPFGEASQNQVQQVTPFKFGSTNTAQPPAVGFGQVAAAGSAAHVFSFGSGAAAPPPTNSQFNFSMGATSSPGAMANQAQRRIKKAVRRTVLR